MALDKEEARRLRDGGMGLREIAARLGIGKHEVRLACRVSEATGLPRSAWAEAACLQAEGMKQIDIARRLGVSQPSVSKSLKAMRRISSQPEST